MTQGIYLANFQQSTRKFQKLGLWWDTFIQSRKCMSLKFARELCFIAIRNDAKFEEELTCHFKVDMRNLTNFNPKHSKTSKMCSLMDCFWPKHVLFEQEKYRAVMFDGTEDRSKIWKKTNSCYHKWHKIFVKFLQAEK